MGDITELSCLWCTRACVCMRETETEMPMLTLAWAGSCPFNTAGDMGLCYDCGGLRLGRVGWLLSRHRWGTLNSSSYCQKGWG